MMAMAMTGRSGLEVMGCSHSHSSPPRTPAPASRPARLLPAAGLEQEACSRSPVLQASASADRRGLGGQPQPASSALPAHGPLPSPGDTWWEREGAGSDSAPPNQSRAGRLPANGRDAPGLEGRGHREERRRHRSWGGVGRGQRLLGAWPAARPDAERRRPGQSGWRWRRPWALRRRRRRRPARRAPPRCTGSARAFGSTTTRRCWRQCAGRAACAASTSSIRGSRPPRPWGSTDGGEGGPGRGRAGLGPVGRRAGSLSLPPQNKINKKP